MRAFRLKKLRTLKITTSTKLEKKTSNNRAAGLNKKSVELSEHQQLNRLQLINTRLAKSKHNYCQEKV